MSREPAGEQTSDGVGKNLMVAVGLKEAVVSYR